MKKKLQRYSLKKLGTIKKMQNSNQYFLRPRIKPKSTFKDINKNKSAEKNALHHSIFKLSKADQRLKTQHTKMKDYDILDKYQKVLNKKNPQKVDERTDKIKSIIDSKKNIKKIHINPDVFNHTRNIDKSTTPKSGKNYSFRKAHQSYRTKRTALERYISESLENLQIPKKRGSPNSYRHQSGRILKKKGHDTVEKKTLRHCRICDDDTQEVERNDEKGQNSKEKTDHIKAQKSGKLKIQTDNWIKNQTSNKLHSEKGHRLRTQTGNKIRTQTGHRLKTENGIDRQTKHEQQSIQNLQIKWQKKKRNQYDLSREQIEIFGDRFPDGFEKKKLLGRGGFSLVWLGEHKRSHKMYAIKQIITESSHQTHIKQIWFGTYFFQFGGNPKQEFRDEIGINNLVKIRILGQYMRDVEIHQVESNQYRYIIWNVGNTLYELKSENNSVQKLYRIKYKQLYGQIKKDQNILRRIIYSIANALILLSQNNIVHSDLKTQNILIKMQETQIKQIKLIDYGSSFVFSNLRQFSMATPQYMAPQILNFILYQNQYEYIPKLYEYIQNYHYSWVIDIWSLGSVLLQIVSGLPLWMSLKTIVKKNQKEIIKSGLFAIHGRAFDKIIKKQIQVVQNLDYYLFHQNYSGIVLQQDLKLLLQRMLCLNPEKRISPAQIVQILSTETKNSQKII